MRPAAMQLQFMDECSHTSDFGMSMNAGLTHGLAERAGHPSARQPRPPRLEDDLGEPLVAGSRGVGAVAGEHFGRPGGFAGEQVECLDVGDVVRGRAGGPGKGRC